MEKLHLKGLLCWVPRARVVTIVGRLLILKNNLRVGILGPVQVINNQYQVVLLFGRLSKKFE
jgi:hypothetical protein